MNLIPYGLLRSFRKWGGPFHWSVTDVIPAPLWHFAKRATIFAKACFGHPNPSKRQKSHGN